MKPKVAIVGRPNVGKSTLFNRLVGRRTAIVEGMPEITRDRICDSVSWRKKQFTVIDTGGFLPKDETDMRKLVAEQTRHAIDEADLILFMVDGKEGLNALDEEISLLLKKTKKQIFLIVNKLDNLNDEEKIYEFYKLGFKDVLSLSAEHGINTGDLMDLIWDNIAHWEEEKYPGITIAIVGCPNAGKSSLFNELLGEKRSIVHHIAGTTRDAINTEIKIGEDRFLFIDTAGLREKRKVVEDIEYYGNLRSIDSIKKSDMTLLVIDSTTGVKTQDKKIAAFINKSGKASIIISSKWDLIEKQSTADEIKKYKNFYTEKVNFELSFINYSPILFTSIVTKKGVGDIYKAIKEIYEEYNKKIETPKVTRMMQNIIATHPPVSEKGKMLKVYYSYQAGIKPPSFILKVNNPKFVRPAYLKYMEKKIRDNYGFTGCPIKMMLRKS